MKKKLFEASAFMSNSLNYYTINIYGRTMDMLQKFLNPNSAPASGLGNAPFSKSQLHSCMVEKMLAGLLHITEDLLEM